MTISVSKYLDFRVKNIFMDKEEFVTLIKATVHRKNNNAKYIKL